MAFTSNVSVSCNEVYESNHALAQVYLCGGIQATNDVATMTVNAAFTKPFIHLSGPSFWLRSGPMFLEPLRKQMAIVYPSN